MKTFLLFCLIPLLLCSEKIDTFYGPVEVEEPVLLELIESPAFQRLKLIHQYGVGYFTSHREEYTRYDHSLGVFALLRAKGCSLEEQIAGLLHDVSHTAFSHVGDWIFGKAYQDADYQGSIHKKFLEERGLEEILKKYNLAADQILPIEEFFPALEQKRPNLCADRIDYNIQGAFHQGFITREEAREIFEELRFIEGNWVSGDLQAMEKLVHFSLFMNQDCWGSASNYCASRWLADAILRAIDIGCLSYEDVHFGTDQVIWDHLMSCEDPIVQNKMNKIVQAESCYCLVDAAEADFIVTPKFMGIDPWILSERKVVRLTAISPAVAKEFRQVKEKLEKGWAIKLL